MNEFSRFVSHVASAMALLVLVSFSQARAEDISMFDPREAGVNSNDPSSAPDFKESGMFHGWTRRHTSKEQFERGQSLQKEGSLSKARAAYEALVCKWGTSPEAPRAQIAIAKIFEEQEDYQEAFKEWQYYLEHYSNVGIIDGVSYEDAVVAQFRIAEKIRAQMNDSMIALFAPSPRTVASYYHRITKNSPAGEYADDSVYLEALCLEQDADQKAVPVYERLVAKYPESEYVVEALYRAALCRQRLSVRAPNDERTAIHALDALERALRVSPEHPEAAKCRAFADALRTRINAIAYGKAEFYDRIRRNPVAAVMAYREFLRQHPDAEEAETVKARLAEIVNENPAAAAAAAE